MDLATYDNLGTSTPLTHNKIISDVSDETNIIDKEALSIKESEVKLETIFDHNPTEKEIPKFTAWVISKERYIREFSQDSHYYDIYCLYLMRDDKETAQKYYLMISEANRKAREEIIKNRVIA